MKKFNFKKFFTIKRDKTIKDENTSLYVELTGEGKKLMGQYFQNKSNASIEILDYKNQEEFLKKAPRILKKITSKKPPASFRHCFVLETPNRFDGLHSSPIFYIKEGDKEGFVILDSLPDGYLGPHFARKLQAITGIPVYTLEDSRQFDTVSCHTDCVNMGNKVTRHVINGNESYYELPNFLSLIHANSQFDDGCFIIQKLPNALLKGAQISKFVKKHAIDPDEKFYSGKTLTQFRESYKEPVTFYYSPEESEELDINSFLRKKGLKYADIIEIQFYFDEINKEIGKAWNPNEKKSFVAQARTLLTNQGNDFQNRPGLYSFAVSTLDHLRKSKGKLNEINDRDANILKYRRNLNF